MEYYDQAYLEKNLEALLNKNKNSEKNQDLENNNQIKLDPILPLSSVEFSYDRQPSQNNDIISKRSTFINTNKEQYEINNIEYNNQTQNTTNNMTFFQNENAPLMEPISLDTKYNDFFKYQTNNFDSNSSNSNSSFWEFFKSPYFLILSGITLIVYIFVIYSLCYKK